jgi:hypothetical protein
VALPELADVLQGEQVEGEVVDERPSVAQSVMLRPVQAVRGTSPRSR